MNTNTINTSNYHFLILIVAFIIIICLAGYLDWKDRKKWEKHKQKESELSSKVRYQMTKNLESELKESEQNIFMN